MALNKDDALTVVRKLRAEKREGRRRSPHEMYAVYHGELQVATFGVSRSPNRNKGHGHLPLQLRISLAQTAAIAECEWYYDDYIGALREKELL